MKATPRTAASIARSIADFKLKAPVFPEGMVIIQDTREQAPLFGPRLPKGMTLCSEKLDTGDLSIRGFKDTFCVERKRISDLLSFCTTERDKTKAKMERMSKMEWSALIVEAKESEIYRPYLYSQISPELIRQCLVSFSIRYHVAVYIGPRENCQRYFLDHAIKYYKVKKAI